MENTLENKAKFFAIYWGQKVFKSSINQDIPHKNTFGKSIRYSDFLELKPLSSISNQDAIEVYNIMIPLGKSAEKERIFYGRSFIKDYDTTNETLEFAQSYLDIQRAIDFLRSRGYALPWMGLSVEQLIKYGWIKLKK